MLTEMFIALKRHAEHSLVHPCFIFPSIFLLLKSIGLSQVGRCESCHKEKKGNTSEWSSLYLIESHQKWSFQCSEHVLWAKVLLEDWTVDEGKRGEKDSQAQCFRTVSSSAVIIFRRFGHEIIMVLILCSDHLKHHIHTTISTIMFVWTLHGIITAPVFHKMRAFMHQVRWR